MFLFQHHFYISPLIIIFNNYIDSINKLEDKVQGKLYKHNLTYNYC